MRIVPSVIDAHALGRYYNDRYNVTIASMLTLKLTQIGNSVGVILPREMLARLKLEKGQSVFLTETPTGYVLTPYDPALAEQVEAGRQFMREYRDTFHELAK
jgi:putative addiction module antidote